jgi:hypothetical protein
MDTACFLAFYELYHWWRVLVLSGFMFGDRYDTLKRMDDKYFKPLFESGKCIFDGCELELDGYYLRKRNITSDKAVRLPVPVCKGHWENTIEVLQHDWNGLGLQAGGEDDACSGLSEIDFNEDESDSEESDSDSSSGDPSENDFVQNDDGVSEEEYDSESSDSSSDSVNTCDKKKGCTERGLRPNACLFIKRVRRAVTVRRAVRRRAERRIAIMSGMNV